MPSDSSTSHKVPSHNSALALVEGDGPSDSDLHSGSQPEVVESLPKPIKDLNSYTSQPFAYDVPRSREQSQKIEAFKQTLERHRGERQLIVLQDFPDPDALSSAWTYKLIAQNFDIQCDMVYGGTLSHQENIALVKLTSLPVQRWALPTLKTRDLAAYQGCALIDNQGTTSQLMPSIQEAGIPTTVVIDHHSMQGDIKAEFIDIRPYTRATATILTQYLQTGLLKLDSNSNEHVKCATALMHGLRSDTNALRQAQEVDFTMASS
jgi:nanoRNase/pAp phosphatase (c-di-AMP/oligoRNAs hydrolase)